MSTLSTQTDRFTGCLVGKLDRLLYVVIPGEEPFFDKRNSFVTFIVSELIGK